MFAKLAPLCKGLAILALTSVAPFASANVVGSDAQNFNPITSGLDFVTVHSSETLEPGIFNSGLFLNYARNALPYYGTGAQRSKRDSSLTGGDFNFGIGLLQGWDAGISFPVIVSQSVSDDSAIGHYSNSGSTEFRINTKFRLFGDQDHGMAVITSANFNRIARNPYVGEGGGPILNLEVAADTTVGALALALNLGHRWRQRGEPIAGSGIEPLADQWLASAALSYLMQSIDTKLVFEALAALPKQSQLKSTTDREYTVLEANLGLKYDSGPNLSLHIGAGSGLLQGTSSPDYRVYTGMNFSFGNVRSSRSVDKDPYRVNRPHARQAARPPVAKAESMTPPTARTKRPPKVQAPVPTPEPPVIAESPVPPAQSTETVRGVKVFNRGDFNHIVLQAIEFQAGTKTLKPASEAYLKNEFLPTLRELNRRRRVSRLVIEGHTDSLGSEAYNLRLSQARAETVAALLRQSLGDSIPIEAIGRGESEPIADDGNYQGRALNRRVEIKLHYQRSSR